VEIALPFRDDLPQQKGYAHGGTLVTSEYKINLLASATSGLVARGEVVKAGRTLTVARAEVYADDRTHIATMQQTLMMLPGRTDHRE